MTPSEIKKLKEAEELARMIKEAYQDEYAIFDPDAWFDWEKSVPDETTPEETDQEKVLREETEGIKALKKKQHEALKKIFGSDT